MNLAARITKLPRSAGFLPPLILALALAGAPGGRTDDAPGADAFEGSIRPLLDTYCLKCHGPEKPKAGVNLSVFTNTASIQADPRAWETVLTQLRERNMPPENKPQPTQEERDRLADWITHLLENLDESHVPPDPGRKIIHRLSRLEYNNTLRDLLGVDTRPADRFPPDGGGGGGFDNNADTLFIPPILMEQYLAAAGEIIEAADPAKIFITRPGWRVSGHAAAKQILRHLGTRAFRRPIDHGELDALLNLYSRAVAGGNSHERAVKVALKAILVSPSFLFRIETTPTGSEPQAITDYELASRLSYFLWSSMPDDALFELAAVRRLRESAVLEAQVKRMLRDPKSRAFAENFASQWLRTRELKTSVQPDRRRFPEYTPELRDAMYAEPVEFFHALLRRDGSLLELLDARYAYVNADLAALYGIEGVEGGELRRVELTDRARGGVLGMAGILTLTSYPLRTSPVLRGKWVLEEILGTPPPPPPPLIKSLPRDDKPREGLSFRQQLEAHRSDPNCASCHQRMDPLGFGLENFDAIGRWRVKSNDQPVDASGEMPTGEKFEGPEGLREILLARKDEFARNATEKMLAYALGRGLELPDIPTVRRIRKALAENDYRAGTLIMEIVQSHPFQFRRAEPAATAGQTRTMRVARAVNARD